VGLAQADAAEEDDVGLFGDKAQFEEVADLGLVDLLGPNWSRLLRTGKRAARRRRSRARCCRSTVSAAMKRRRNSACDHLAFAASAVSSPWWRRL